MCTPKAAFGYRYRLHENKKDNSILAGVDATKALAE